MRRTPTTRFVERDPIIETLASSRRRRRDRRENYTPVFAAALVLAVGVMVIVIAVFLELGLTP